MAKGGQDTGARDQVRGHIIICDLLHQNESHVADPVFELDAGKGLWCEIYQFWVTIIIQQYEWQTASKTV